DGIVIPRDAKSFILIPGDDRSGDVGANVIALDTIVRALKETGLAIDVDAKGVARDDVPGPGRGAPDGVIVTRNVNAAAVRRDAIAQSCQTARRGADQVALNLVLVAEQEDPRVVVSRDHIARPSAWSRRQPANRRVVISEDAEPVSQSRS